MSILPKFLYKKESLRKKPNLRQQVKQAKKQLAALECAQQPSNQVEMVIQFERKRDLQRIVDFKRKPSRYYHFNEPHEIDFKKLTYIAIYADFDKLAELKSPNGKPLNPEVVDAFIDLIIKTKFYDYAKKVSEMEWRTHKGIDTNSAKRDFNTVCYSLKVSNDHTKQKRFHSESFYYQVRGEDKLYKPNRGKFAGSEASS